MTEVKLPSLGEGVESGTIVSILVNVGEMVQIDQPLLEVETDKVTAEVPAEFSGVIQEILVNIGDEIPEGTTLFTLTTTASAKSDETKGEAVPEVNFIVPEKEPEPKVKTEEPSSLRQPS